MERILQLTGAANVRDLGGYPSQKSQVRFRKVIRAAAIHQLTPADSQQLADYGVTQVVDFRSAKERAKAPDANIPQVENISLPIFPEKEQTTASPGTLFEQIQAGMDGATQMRAVYRHFVEEEYSRKAYRRFFEILLNNDKPGESVLFHCTAGKDRTGFGAALILASLEVDQDEIVKNYLETNQNLVKTTDQVLKEAQSKGASAFMLAGIKEVLAAREDYLAESYGAIQTHYGDMTGFLHQGLGLSKQDLSDFRQLYRE